MDAEAVSIQFWVVAGLALNLWAFMTFKDEEPYMDEFFHIRQAQQYCRGDWSSWDPKITTFPGLYYLSAGLHSLLGGLDETTTTTTTVECSPSFLRSISFLLSCSLVPLLMLCRRQAVGRVDHIPALLYLYPGNAMYYCLFYTDTASLASFLACYVHAHASLSPSSSPFRRTVPHSLVALLLSTASLLMRQTNSVWLVFLAGSQILRYLQATQTPPGGRGEEAEERSLVHQVVEVVRGLGQHSGALLGLVWPYLLPVLGFAVYVLGVNHGSVVLGDQDHHRPALHYALLVYPALVYTCLATLPLVLGRERRTGWIGEVKKRPGLYAGIGLTAWSAVYWGSLAHPFLLADNRHYTFYLWRRVLQGPGLSRGVWAGVCGASSVVTLADLRQTCSPLWLLGLAISLALTLLPSPLLEPRYLSQAATVALLHSPLSSSYYDWRGETVQCAGMMVVLAGLLTTFLLRPFTWQDGSLARFML